MRIAALVLGFSLVACTDPVSEEAGSDSGGKGDGAGASHKLPGFDEALLTGSHDGKLAVIHVGDRFSKQTVELSTTQGPNVIRARDGKFYALFDAGTLAVIDPATAKVERTLAVGAAPQDIEWSADGKLYVSTGSTVATHDFATGTKLDAVELKSLATAGGTVQTRRLLRIGDRVFVQVARANSSGRPENGVLAIVKSGAIEKTMELGCLEPDFDLVHDTRRNHLYVTCAGVRPVNTGLLVRIDTTTLAVHDREQYGAGWQGIVQFADPFDTLFVIYHTSTPTTSSHLFARPVASNGKLGSGQGGTIVDAFDGLDALSMNKDGTLVAMANHCLVGFCIGGAGINFIDTVTQEKQQKLLEAELGFEPAIAVFAR